jgi:dephospho-CoA kinase
MIIGLTGGIGSGKTTVANLFKKFDSVAVYIADFEAKKIMNTSEYVREQIIEAFGKDVYKENGLDPKYLANIVFNDKQKLQLLNKIIHPVVREKFQEFVRLNEHKTYIIYESAILFESGTAKQFDFVISIFLDLENRINRVKLRDNCSRQVVLDRIQNQWKEDKKLLLSNYIIDNSNLEITGIMVKYIHNILTKKRFDFL